MPSFFISVLKKSWLVGWRKDFVSYYSAENANSISKGVLLNLMKNKRVKNCEIDYLQEDKKKFLKILNKYLTNKNAK